MCGSSQNSPLPGDAGRYAAIVGSSGQTRIRKAALQMQQPHDQRGPSLSPIGARSDAVLRAAMGEREKKPLRAVFGAKLIYRRKAA
jgi:hypothetical protein